MSTKYRIIVKYDGCDYESKWNDGEPPTELHELSKRISSLACFTMLDACGNKYIFPANIIQNSIVVLEFALTLEDTNE